MRYVLSIILPILLLTIGIWYSINIHKRYLITWSKEITLKDILIYSFPTFIKSIIIMYLILLIHNSIHYDSYLQLTVFIALFFVFSVIQSPFSLGGFLTRSKNLFYQVRDFYRDKSERADRFVNKIIDIFVGRGQILIKLLIFVGFIIVFIPNITLFITTNILYFLLTLFLVSLSLILNNIIYFGFVALLIFQFDPAPLTFENVNWLVLFSSYIVLLLGLSLENRLERKMFYVVTVMEVKKFNFKLGYNILITNRNTIVYQNVINHYYYVYFRKIGLVVVYYCDFDLTLSNYISRQMVKEAKRYLFTQQESST